MARPRKFDREEALDKALDLFWSHGFEATTMSDLQRELGIGRQSLYTTFGDKHQIFAEALDRYVTSADAMLADRFGPSAGVEAIRAHLHFGAQTLTSGDRRGCLVMNTCIELAPHDEGARLLTNRHLSALRAHFESAIETSRERGELGPSGDTTAEAMQLVTLGAGMAVLARAGATLDELVCVADNALASLEKTCQA